MRWNVRFTDAALEDLVRLEDFLLDQALRHGDPGLPARAMQAIERAMSVLESNPYTCRSAGMDGTHRELVIPFGASGYVAMFRIDAAQVWIGAVRHQREDDYH